jgi:hypothetical protein
LQIIDISGQPLPEASVQLVPPAGSGGLGKDIPLAANTARFSLVLPHGHHALAVRLRGYDTKTLAIDVQELKRTKKNIVLDK